MMDRAPSLFIGHGSPMHAIQKNAFTEHLAKLPSEIGAEAPRAVLVISAHWETRGLFLQASPNPETIYDFGGFPTELSEVVYSAPGSPEVAKEVADLVAGFKPKLTLDWGFDHGAWAVLRHLYPKADVPVLPMSLNERLSLKEHFELARALRPLRDQGVLILGSGNIVHNLSLLRWRDPQGAYDWAVRFDQNVADLLQAKDAGALISLLESSDPDMQKSVPSLEHFLPLIYNLGASFDDETVSFPYTGLEMGSISMRSVLFKAA